MKKTVLIVICALVIIFIAFFFAGIYFTNDYVNEETRKLINEAKQERVQTFNYAEIDKLPPVLQKYFSKVIDEGSVKPRFVRLKQEGYFKTNHNAEFKELTAEQYFITTKPGFIWQGKINFGKFIWITGIDNYYKGKGNLLIKFMSGITITKESGKEINQSQIIRWLLETVWFPTALLSNGNMKWIKYDSTSATVSLDENDIEVTATFHFNNDGLISKITSERYMTTVSGPALTKFTGYVSNYKKFNGFLIPTHVQVEWNLIDQDFRYGKFNVTEIDYDNFDMYE